DTRHEASINKRNMNTTLKEHKLFKRQYESDIELDPKTIPSYHLYRFTIKSANDIRNNLQKITDLTVYDLSVFDDYLIQKYKKFARYLNNAVKNAKKIVEMYEQRRKIRSSTDCEEYKETLKNNYLQKEAKDNLGAGPPALENSTVGEQLRYIEGKRVLVIQQNVAQTRVCIQEGLQILKK